VNKYIAQPKFDLNVVTIYDITAGSSAQPIVLSANADITALTQITGAFPNQGGPNSVLIYQDFSGKSSPKQCLIVAYLGATANNGQVSGGAVYVFDLDAIMAAGSGMLPAAIATLQFPGYYPVGMAIQPGTGDLFVATPALAPGSNPTVTIFPKTTGGTWSNAGSNNTTIDYNSLNGFSSVPSNLAFDRHGFLWMTSFGGDPTYNYLLCLRGIVSAIPASVSPPPIPLPVPSQAKPAFFFTNNYAAGNVAGMLPVTQIATTPPTSTNAMPAHLWGLSSPEGLAFDPDGNLWVANNNEEYDGSDINPKFNGSGGGSIMMIRAKYLDQLLFPTAPADGTQILLNSIPSGSAVVYYLGDQAQPGGLFFDGYNLYVNDENGVYVSSQETLVWRGTVANGVLSNLTSVPQPGGLRVQTGSSNGNGTMGVFNFAPNATPSQLLIKDGAWDTAGSEPDMLTASEYAWESSEIGVYVTAQSGLGAGSILNGSVNWSNLGMGADGKPEAFLYVRVTNVSAAPTFGTEVLKLYWAHGSAALQWPAPWDGLVADVSASGSPALGGYVGAVALPVMAAGATSVIQVVWSDVPAPLIYTDEAGDTALQDHFCLLARVEGSGQYPFGMTDPEQWNFFGYPNLLPTQSYLGTNVVSNRAIAWRNVQITEDSGQMVKHHLGILGGNYGTVEALIGFELQTLGRDGKAHAFEATVHVIPHGSARRRFLEHEGLKRGEGGRFLWVDHRAGLRNIRCLPGEVLPFTIEFRMDREYQDYAVRVVQYEEREGHRVITGGQTFVFGEVKGFPIRTRAHYGVTLR